MYTGPGDGCSSREGAVWKTCRRARNSSWLTSGGICRESLNRGVCSGDSVARVIRKTSLKFYNNLFCMLGGTSLERPVWWFHRHTSLPFLFRLYFKLLVLISQPSEYYYLTSVFCFFRQLSAFGILNKKQPLRCFFRASVLMFSAFVIKTPAVNSKLAEESFHPCSDRGLWLVCVCVFVWVWVCVHIWIARNILYLDYRVSSTISVWLKILKYLFWFEGQIIVLF